MLIRNLQQLFSFIVNPGAYSSPYWVDYQLLKLRKAHVGKDWTDLFVHNVYNRPGSNTLAQLNGNQVKIMLIRNLQQLFSFIVNPGAYSSPYWVVCIHVSHYLDSKRSVFGY
jgi:hypothetical protein